MSGRKKGRKREREGGREKEREGGRAEEREGERERVPQRKQGPFKEKTIEAPPQQIPTNFPGRGAPRVMDACPSRCVNVLIHAVVFVRLRVLAANCGPAALPATPSAAALTLPRCFLFWSSHPSHFQHAPPPNTHTHSTASRLAPPSLHLLPVKK